MSLDIISPNFTEAHLNEIIKKKGGLRHTSWAFEGAAGKKGDGYLSEVYKLILKGVDEKDEEFDVHLVIKTTPKSKGRRKTFRSSDFFRNEINFYNIILKEFDEFQEKKTQAKNPFKEIATCLAFHLDGENDLLVLENLNNYGYHTRSRQESMNINLCRLIMRTLGRFHGLSFVIRDQNPKLFETISEVLEETYYAYRLKPWYNDFINMQIEVALDAVKKIYGGTIIEKRAKKFLNDGSLYDKMVELTHTRNCYSVIGHGDCWTPNFLIHSTKHEGQETPVKAKMIDFQLARFASPVIDISFFIYSCTTEELRVQYYDDLIKKLPFKLNELKTFFRFGVGMGIESIPFSTMEDNETADMDQIIGDDAVPITNIWILKEMENMQDQHRLADIFKHASDCGYLD
ncbi:CLUMA_CG005088, isoform A [Clunio marinus]|uniref:CLUMA_CG005088, isoform A n=1 Tax=Clunio marinus TaxID=568069 RepID=A0A1J1HTU6_9DIPT|nr:CLUMA_CG005088, isoform A [Clunio marinus]